MYKKLSLSAFLLCSAMYAGDVTPEFLDHMNRQFGGLQASASKVWDHTWCTARSPLDNHCIAYAGDKIYGDATISIKNLIRSSGTMNRSCAIDADTGENLGCAPKTDIVFAYDYSGKSTGKKQCYPGNYFCGWEWEDLSPGGTVEIRLRADRGTLFSMIVNYYVYPGHDDKPNGLAADAARSLKLKAKEAVEQYLALKNMSVDVFLAN